jgi:subtilisin family serine protease
MNDDVAGPHYATRRLPQRVRDRPIPWVPGEMLVGVHVDVPPGTEPSSLVVAIRGIVTKILGDVQIAAPPPDPPLLIPTLEGQRHLVFAPITLGSPEPRTMRVAIASLNSADGRAQFEAVGLTPVAATPNWFGASQSCSGGSPASMPVPVDPYGGRIRYAPQLEELDLAHEAQDSGWAETGTGPDRLHVAVLDTAPTRGDLAWAHQQFPRNTHLQQLLERLVLTGTGYQAAQMDAALQRAMAALEQNGGFRPIEPAEAFDIRDHGLFVASVIHATAPWARIRLMRVLNNFGVGSLHSLTIALATLIQSKRPEEPLVINLSLGLLPPLEQLLDIWFGFAIDGLPGCPENAELQFLPGGKPLSRADLQVLVARKDPAVTVNIDLLQEPLRQLMAALLANNCLVIAAAGNDSVYRGVQRHPRWGPRLPALYDQVLGVAADTVRPGTPARYSNRGEAPAASVRDAVATLGGDLAPDGLSPSGGVIGVYSAEQFPPFLPPAGPALNETGWAQWAGTSFATPIIAGIAANFWATHPDTARPTLHKINALVHQRANVPDLGVPAVPTRLTWLP